MLSNPTDPYSPNTNVSCQGSLLRSFSPTNSSRNPGEVDYTNNRKPIVQAAWTSWIVDPGDIGYGSNMLPLGDPPMVGMVMDGGGLRGTLFSAGVMNAFDSNNATAKRLGTGGFLGTALFQAGGAGASFLLPGGSFSGFRTGNFIAVPNNTEGAALNMGLVTPGGSDVLAPNNQDYYGAILTNVKAKSTAGYPTSLIDVWGRMLAYHFLNGTTRNNFYTNDTAHGANVLFSDLPQQPSFQNHSIPLPIMTLNSQVSTDPSSAVVYEVTPYEMGSFDPRLSAMTPTKYLGTQLSNGSPSSDDSCVTGFDQSSLLLGTTSSPFYNAADGLQPNITGFDSDDSNAWNYLLGWLKNSAKAPRYDVSNWPNPFKAINQDSYPASGDDLLSLGGAQNYLPIEQLLVKDRNVGVIVVLDSTGETTENKWPDGTAMNVAKQRVDTILSQTHKPFPPIPRLNDFVDTGVNLRPTFFGCPMGATNSTKPDWPLIIYIPNAPPADGSAPVTNPTGFKTSYTELHQQRFFDQAYGSATSGFVPGQTGADKNFPKCLQCAAVDLGRFPAPGSTSSFVSRSPFCETCFKQYCYDPSNPPSKNDLPHRQLTFVDPDSGNESFMHQHRTQIAIGVAIGAAALIAITIAFVIWRRRKVTTKRRGLRPDPIKVPSSDPTYEPLYSADLHSGRRSSEPLAESSPIEMPQSQVHYRDPYVFSPTTSRSDTHIPR